MVRPRRGMRARAFGACSLRAGGRSARKPCAAGRFTDADKSRDARRDGRRVQQRQTVTNEPPRATGDRVGASRDLVGLRSPVSRVEWTTVRGEQASNAVCANQLRCDQGARRSVGCGVAALPSVLSAEPVGRIQSAFDARPPRVAVSCFLRRRLRLASLCRRNVGHSHGLRWC